MAWWGRLNSNDSAPSPSLSGEVEEAVWLPDERFAQSWREYQRTGAVSDDSAPTAPHDVKARVLAEGAVEVSWQAEADLESGIKAFIVMRDGAKIGAAPEKPVGRYGRPLFQSMSYHDTPETPLPEMRFVDSTAERGSEHAYRVIAINSVGLRSAPSNAAFAQ